MRSCLGSFGRTSVLDDLADALQGLSEDTHVVLDPGKLDVRGVYPERNREKGFDDTYNGGEPSAFLTVPEQVSALKRIREVVVAGYVECKPCRDLLKDLEIATAIVEGQAPK